MTDATAPSPTSTSRVAAIVLAVVVALAAAAALALRATWGITPLDDGHYAATTLHLMNGAVPFKDEMMVQALGFLPVVPFAKLWTTFFGMTGVVLALRMVYVLYAAAAGATLVWALRPTFGLLRPLFAFCVVVLAPPYNIIGVSYNTSVMLCFLVASSLAFAATRDRSWRKAAVAGAVAALGAAAYAPLIVGALALAITTSFVSRDRRVVLGIFGGGLGTAAVLAGVLFSWTSVAALQRTISYAGMFTLYGTTEQKILRLLTLAQEVLLRQTTWPIYVLAIAAAIPALGKRVRGIAVALVPFAAAAPGVLHLAAGGDERYFGVYPTSYLIFVTLGLAVPVAVWAVTERPPLLGTLLIIATPMSLLSLPLVAFATSSGFFYAIWFIALAPLTLALLVGWTDMVQQALGRPGVIVMGAVVLLLAGGLLYAVGFKDVAPLQADAKITTGALAGISTSQERANALEALQAAAARFVRPDYRVTALGGGTAYLLTGGQEYSPITWLNPGPPDKYIMEYFNQKGHTPDVVIVPRNYIDDPGGLDAAAKTDPLLELVASSFHVEDAGPYYYLYVRDGR